MCASAAPEPVAPSRDRCRLDWLWFFGVAVLALSVLSVFFTAAQNARTATQARCGYQAILDTANALRSRDAAQINLNDASRVIVETRHDVLLILAGQPPVSTPETLNEAVKRYNAAYITYRAAIDAFDLSIKAAPVPSGDCLNVERNWLL